MFFRNGFRIKGKKKLKTIKSESESKFGKYIYIYIWPSLGKILGYYLKRHYFKLIN